MSWTRRLPSLFETSTFRHASLTALIFLLVAVGSVVLIGHQIEALMHTHVREMILADVQNQEKRDRLTDSSKLAAVLRRDEENEREGGMSLVLSPAGEALYGDRRLLQVLDCARACRYGWRNQELQDVNGNVMRMQGLQVPLDDGGVFFRAYDVFPMLERVRVIPLVASLALLGVLLSSLAIGLYSSVRNMRRVDRIRAALRRYVGGDRDAIVPTNRKGDEIDLLGGDINHVLGRVNGLMEEVKSVTSILAHELRTPLTRLHNHLVGVAERLDDELRDDIMDAVAEAERIQRIFKAVLRIGEIEAGRCAYSFEWFDADAFLHDVADYYQPLVESARLRLHIQAEVGGDLYGDRALLFQAISNLLENAIKYGSQASDIFLLVRLHDDCIELGVADNGPGIRADLRDEAVRRFRRLETQSQDGSGLGLALVNAIAKLHAGELVLGDHQPRGLLAVLRLNASNWNSKTGSLATLKF
ncbi:HAMP domain-containing sensor histidine kinase [Herbaspirillum lusitanum]|uniref:histidine kinase n=1 Tax=Herbaspirillum lusitanum TaxID=213312 RepID=A0ABW9A4S9_9BURK